MSIESILESAALAHRQGRLADAEVLYKSALASDPRSYRILVSLSVLSRMKGDLDSALSFATEAIAARPTSMEGRLQLGLCLLGKTQFQEASEAFREAIRIKPDLAPLHHNLALCLENLGQKDGAIEAFRTAVRLAPQDVRSQISLGALFLADDKIDLAFDLASRAIRTDPNAADAHLLMAKIFTAQKKDEEAEVYIRTAIALNPNSPHSHAMLGFRLIQHGEFEQAEECFRRSLRLDAVQGISYFGITQSRKIAETDRPLIQQMESVLADGWLSYDEIGYLQYGLSKAYDNLGEYEKAIDHCREAHQFSFYLKGGKRLDRNAYSDYIDSTIQLYSRELVEGYSGESFDSDLPVFIVGMMRSGTTLTEQIVSSHPSVAAAGEHWFWPARAYQADDRTKMQFHSKQATSLAREYCRSLGQVSKIAERITDKLPGNYGHLGLLHLALPNAKFIHTNRNPVDTSLSIYFTPNPTAPDFSHSPEDIVFVYRQYLRLMEHWRRILPPGRILEIVYEELVTNPEPTIRRIIEFCGLKWDDACLHHERNASRVKTPSHWQVRQPMYTTSAGKWKRYEPWLGGFAELISELPSTSFEVG